MRACEKRPIGADIIERIISEIEYELQDYLMQVPSRVIGEKVLKKLKELDDVAYIRFASVYRQFQDMHGFLKEIDGLKKETKKTEPEQHPRGGRYNVQPKPKKSASKSKSKIESAA